MKATKALPEVIKGLCGLLLLSCSLHHSTAQTSPEGERYFKAANQYLDRKEYQQAIDQYSLSLKYIPSGENIYYLRGHARHKLGQYKAALADFDTAINLNRNIAIFYNARAWTHCFTGDYAKAVSDANKAISLEKKAEYYDTRATAYGLRLFFMSAISDFHEAIKADPRPLFFYKRGLARKANNDLSAAEQDFAQARKLDPTESYKRENDPLFVLVTDKYISTGNVPQAVKPPSATADKKDLPFMLREDQFSMQFPGTPEIRRESNANFSKAITAKFKTGSKLYYFGYRVLNDDYFSGLAWGEILDELRELYVSSFDAKASDIVHLQEKESYEGIESDMYKVFKPGTYALFRDVGVLKGGYKLYRIGLIYPDRFPTREELNEFYKEFKLTY